jgi:hypothetical protein
VNWALAGQWLAITVSIVIGADAWRRARRSDERAERAERRADEAESRADRMEARSVERTDVRWECGFLDVHTFQVVNRGLDTAHDVVILVRLGEASEEIQAAEMPRDLARVITTPAGVEMNNRVAAELSAMHAQGGPAWIPEITIPAEIRIFWRTALGAPQQWESGEVDLPVPMMDKVRELNRAADRGRLPPWP